MEKTINDFKDYDGVDANLETSLYEYGLIWIKGTEGHEKDYHFIYGVSVRESEAGDMEYYQFDWGDIPIDCDLMKEFDWVDWNEVLKCMGLDGVEIIEYLKNDIPSIISDLLSYYGYENVFGSSYYPFEIDRKGD